jgi:hypothetical protein
VRTSELVSERPEPVDSLDVTAQRPRRAELALHQFAVAFGEMVSDVALLMLLIATSR